MQLMTEACTNKDSTGQKKKMLWGEPEGKYGREPLNFSFLLSVTVTVMLPDDTQ